MENIKILSLTAKQEAFAQGIVAGLGQADTYRAAYDCEKMGANSIYPNAGKQATHEATGVTFDEVSEDSTKALPGGA